MLPNDTPIHIVEEFITRAYQHSISEKRMKLVENGLCHMERIQVRKILFSCFRNFQLFTFSFFRQKRNYKKHFLILLLLIEVYYVLFAKIRSANLYLQPIPMEKLYILNAWKINTSVL